MKRTLFLLALVICMASSTPALAHKLKLFASVVGVVVEGRVYFVGGGAAMDVPVTLLDSGGNAVATTRTSEPEGSFILNLAYRDNYTLKADAQDGHVATFAIGQSRLPDSLPLAPGASETGQVEIAEAASMGAVESTGSLEAADFAPLIEEAVARQVAPLADEIEVLRDTIGLRDMVGGIGAIFGAFGLWALFASRRRRP